MYSWGLNNWGQLGIGNRENTSTPTEIKEFKNVDIKMISGGAHHAIALTEDGHVYSWGKNEDGQLGIGDTYSEFNRKKAEQRQKIETDEYNENVEINKQIKEAEQAGKKEEVKNLKRQQKKSTKKYTKMKQDDENIEDILYFTTPQKVPELSNIKFINSGATYNYAISTSPWIEDSPKDPVDKENDIQNKSSDPMSVDEKVKNGDKHEDIEEAKIPKDQKESKIEEEKHEEDSNSSHFYSWGIGNSFILWTREEESVYKPYKIPPLMHKGLEPVSVSWGTIHVVFLVTESKSQDKKKPEPVTDKTTKIDDKQTSLDAGIGKKRKIDEIEKDDEPAKDSIKIPSPENEQSKDNSKDEVKINSPKDEKSPKDQASDASLKNKMDNIKISDDKEQKSDKRPKPHET